MMIQVRMLSSAKITDALLVVEGFLLFVNNNSSGYTQKTLTSDSLMGYIYTA